MLGILIMIIGAVISFIGMFKAKTKSDIWIWWTVCMFFVIIGQIAVNMNLEQVNTLLDTCIIWLLETLIVALVFMGVMYLILQFIKSKEG